MEFIKVIISANQSSECQGVRSGHLSPHGNHSWSPTLPTGATRM